MKLDKKTYQKLQDINILDVADKLQLKYSSKGNWRKALCFIHDDHTPSLGINPAGNKWKCFSCGKGGSHIDLVMQHENLSFNDACEWLIREFCIPVPQQENRQSLINSIKDKLMDFNRSDLPLGSSKNDSDNVNLINPELSAQPLDTCNATTLSPQLLERFKGTSNEFTRAIVNCNILTPDQMRHAADTFRLSTIDDSVIFWQIDAGNNIREGKVMYYQADAHRSHSRKPVTISWLLKQQNLLPSEWKARNCLFGLHQISSDDTQGYDDDNDTLRYENDNCIIAIVESEKTAIICSELLPSLSGTKVLWMATGGLSTLSVECLRPLKGHKVILFPDTDLDGTTYQKWLTIATEAAKQFGHPITVSPLLERNATREQKERKIDIADYILECGE